MATLDIIILVIIGSGVLRGFLKGALKQAAGLLGLTAGLMAARALYALVAKDVFSHAAGGMTPAQALAFLAVWLLVPSLFLLAASVLAKALEAVSLGWLNRLLGAVAGGLLHALVASLLACVLEHADRQNELVSRRQKQESALYHAVKPLAGLFFPEAKEFAEQIYNEINDATKRI